MQDVVTLFGSEPLEFTQVREVSVGQRTAWVMLHTPRARGSIDVQGSSDVHRLYAQVTKAAEKLGADGGGLVVTLVPDGGALWVLRVIARAGDDYQPPLRALELRPGYAPRRRELDRDIRLEAGARLILPTDEACTRALEAWLEGLQRFSPDVASNTLATLCAPALDLRVRRLERWLEGKRAGGRLRRGALGGFEARWQDVRDKVRARPVASGLAAAALLVCAVLVWDAAWGFSTTKKIIARLGGEQATSTNVDSRSSGSGGSRTDGSGAGKGTVNPSKGADPKGGALTPRYRALDALRAQLTKPTTDARLQGLYATHFTVLADMQPGHEDKVFQDPAFAYGLVWLLTAQAKDTSIWSNDFMPAFGSSGHDQQARAALRALRDGKKLTPEDLALLVEVTCEAFPENFVANKPGLPAATDKERADLSGKCWTSPQLSALQQLTRGIANRDKQEQPGTTGETAGAGTNADAAKEKRSDEEEK